MKSFLKIDNVAIVNSIIIVVLVFIGAFHTWEYGDDYLNRINMSDKSPLKYIWDYYFINDGRFVSPYGVVMMSLIKYTNAPLAVFFYLICLFVSCWLILKILFERFLNDVVSVKNLMVFYALLLISLWPLFKDVVYWLTGGFYLASLLQAVTLIYVVLRYFNDCSIVKSTYFKILFAFIVFVLGLNSQNISVPILVIALFLSVKFYLLYSKEFFNWIIVILIPLFSAMLVTNLAPGNFERLAQEQAPLESGWTYIMEGIYMYLKFFNYSKLSLAGGFLFGLFVSNHFSLNATKGDHRTILRNGIICLILAVVSMSPFLIAPDVARIRVYFYGMIFLFLATAHFGFFVGLRFLPSKNFKYLFLNVFLFYGIVFFIWQLSLMIPLSHQVLERRKYLESVRGSADIIEYPALDVPPKLYLIRWADAKRHRDWNRTKDYFELGGYREVEKQEIQIEQ